MRYLFGFLCVCALVGTSPLSASAQAGQEGTDSEPNLKEPAPSSEPASEEPALQLKLDAAGVDVVPSPARTADGYTLEEMDVRVKRARIGLLSTTGFFVVGAALLGGWGACVNRRPSSSLSFFPPECDPLLVTAVSMTFGGFVGMITAGGILGRRKQKLRELKQAHYGRPRRVHWDLETSRVVF